MIRKNLNFLILLPVVVAVLALGGSLFKKPLYKSSVSLLVVQKQAEEIDARAAVKSAEQMADILSRVLDSETFRTALVATGVNLDLSEKPWLRSKEWHKRVKTKNITDTGILIIDVYHPSNFGATKLAGAIKEVLEKNAYDYLGVNPESVIIRELNPPAPTSGGPATPNLFLNMAVAWVFGLILAISLLLLFPNVGWSAYTKFGLGSALKRIRSLPNSIPKKFVPQGGLLYTQKLRQAVYSQGLHPMAANFTTMNGAVSIPAGPLEELSQPAGPIQKGEEVLSFIERANLFLKQKA